MNGSQIDAHTPNLLEIVEASGVDIAVTEIGCGQLLADGGDGAPPVQVCADGLNDTVSDARLKTDIEQVGTTVYGLPLYHFRYLDSPKRFEGVMAQDVLAVMPEAVVTAADGYYRVNYGRLGIEMTAA